MKSPFLDIGNLTGQCSRRPVFGPHLNKEPGLSGLQMSVTDCDSVKTNISFYIGTMICTF